MPVRSITQRAEIQRPLEGPATVGVSKWVPIKVAPTLRPTMVRTLTTPIPGARGLASMLGWSGRVWPWLLWRQVWMAPLTSVSLAELSALNPPHPPALPAGGFFVPLPAVTATHRSSHVGTSRIVAAGFFGHS